MNLPSGIIMASTARSLTVVSLNIHGSNAVCLSKTRAGDFILNCVIVAKSIATLLQRKIEPASRMKSRGGTALSQPLEML